MEWKNMTEEEKLKLAEQTQSVLKTMTKEEEERLKSLFNIEEEDAPMVQRQRHQI